MLQSFITRPILSSVIAILIAMVGVLSMMTLPISQYPDVVPPTIQVTAYYPGASAEDVQKTVSVPLEEQINGVDNMTYMTSQCANDGSCNITVYFEVGTDPGYGHCQCSESYAKGHERTSCRSCTGWCDRYEKITQYSFPLCIGFL
jgi:multidrug efflux pump subunit AcrB